MVKGLIQIHMAIAFSQNNQLKNHMVLVITVYFTGKSLMFESAVTACGCVHTEVHSKITK